MSKPAFDPNKPFDAVPEKPRFDPNAAFEAVPDKTLMERGVDLAARAGQEARAFLVPSESGGGTIAESVPIIGPLGRRAGEGFRALVEGGLSDKESIGQAYDRIRGENERGRQRFAEEHPVADVSQKLLGGIGGAGAIPVLGAGGSGLAAGGMRVASAAGTEAADAALRYGSEEEAARAARLGAGFQAGLEAAPVVGKYAKALKPTVDKVADFLQTGARERAVKAALGNNEKAWKELGRNRIDETGRVALDEGIVTFGAKAGKIADRAKKFGKETWGRVSKSLDNLEHIAEETQGANLLGEEIAQNIERQTLKIPDTPKGRARKQALAEEAQFYRDKGAITPREAQELKGDYVFKFEEPHLAALGRNGTNMVNRSIGDAVKRAGKDFGHKGFAEDYAKYGAASALEKGAEKTHRQLTKNRNPFSLTDYITGGATGVGASLLTGNPSDAMVYGLLSGQANKIMRTRGNSALAVSLNNAARALRGGSATSAQILQALQSGALGGRAGQALAHQIMLQSGQAQAEEQPTKFP